MRGSNQEGWNDFSIKEPLQSTLLPYPWADILTRYLGRL